MRHLTIVIINILIGVFAFTGCHNKKSCNAGPDVSDINIDLQVNRLDQEMFNAASKNDLSAILEENPVITKHFFQPQKFPGRQAMVDQVWGLLKHPSIDTLYNETEEKFGDFTPYQTQFTDAFKNIKAYYPDFTPPKIKTVFTGLGTDMMINDSILAVSLEFYAGKEASYRPKFHSYVLDRYQPENLVPNSILLLGNILFNNDFKKPDGQGEDQTLLAEMLYYGKSYEFADRMMPCLHDSLIAGYSQKQMLSANKSEEIIYSHFVENDLLYDTKDKTKSLYVGERPNVLEIGKKCPGRIGRWLGWKIIEAYMENTGATIDEVMKKQNAREIFEKSEYRPE